MPFFSNNYSNIKDVNENNAIENQLFCDLEDDDLVLELPEGGYLFGEATIENDNGDVIGKYNSQTDDNSITVKEARELLFKERISEGNQISPKGSSIPTSTITLASGASYTSSGFSGSGWRFSGYKFIASSGTGYYLLWCSIGDDGRVGNMTEAYSTLNGTIAGDCIYNGSYTYISKATLSQIYYTYNPISGTYYYVGNI